MFLKQIRILEWTITISAIKETNISKLKQKVIKEAGFANEIEARKAKIPLIKAVLDLNFIGDQVSEGTDFYPHIPEGDRYTSLRAAKEWVEENFPNAATEPLTIIGAKNV